MPLFNVRNIVVPDTHFEFMGIDFVVFRNSADMFERYNAQQENMMFTNCFEYVNKNNLNAKYDILCLFNDDKIYLYIYHKRKDYIISYNFESYLYLLDTYGIDTEIKFMSFDERNGIANDCKVGTVLVDAVYDIHELYLMEGVKYKSFRRRVHKFINRNPDVVFREYRPSDRAAVQAMYDSWKSEKKDNGHMIVDARIFRSGLDSDYMQKFVLLEPSGNLLAFAALYNANDEYCYFYSGKTIRGVGSLSNTDAYFTACILEYWNNNYPTVKYMNMGAIDNPGWKGDFKEQMKPLHLENYINVKIKGS